MDIVVHKFQHLQKAKGSDDFITVDNPDVISFTPVLDSSTYQHGIGTNRYSFKVEYHSQSPSPLGTPTIPLVSPIPQSPSYHVASPSPPLLHQIRSPSPPIIISSVDQDVVNNSPRFAHLGPPFIKNQSDG